MIDKSIAPGDYRNMLTIRTMRDPAVLRPRKHQPPDLNMRVVIDYSHSASGSEEGNCGALIPHGRIVSHTLQDRNPVVRAGGLLPKCVPDQYHMRRATARVPLPVSET